MNIEDAAKATRKHEATETYVWAEQLDRPVAGPFETPEEAQAACDLANLRAVLEMIREPTGLMIAAGWGAGPSGMGRPGRPYTAMIDVLIEEIRRRLGAQC